MIPHDNSRSWYGYIILLLIPSLTFVKTEGNVGLTEYNGPAYFAKSDINMLKVYETIPFENWTQGFSISYDPKEVLHQKQLEVIVMPFSHNDPGWHETFDKYYHHWTDSILGNAMKFLGSHEKMRFVWSEISFLELWWRRHNEDDRQKMMGLVQSGQMEILTGAWVMTDEANTHYYSTIMELMEGHEWIMNHLNVTPEVHWSIDPFGLSPTMAYLIKASGLKHMLIQRTHYAVKRYLAERRQLEFRWRQIWAGSEEKTDIFTHMMPFDSYDLGVSCGPDKEVCCEFDFAHMNQKCPTTPPSSIDPIDDRNVAQKAKVLADQYWKKAQLYTNNVILVPHGSDVRYALDYEWPSQYDNLQRLFTHINENEKRYNMRVQFGTLKDYFRIKDERISENKTHVSTLSGDFFVYADKYDHYWSGYFTSRPFHKHMDRTLQHYLRAADILFTFANQKESASKLKQKSNENNGEKQNSTVYGHLVQARRSLSLFQHHDGITGTSRKLVMEDYANKLASAINSTKIVIKNAAAYLLGTLSRMPLLNEQRLFDMDEDHFSDKLPQKRIIKPNSTVVLFNSLAFERKEVSCVLVANKRTKILAFSKDGISRIAPLQQVHPVFESKLNHLTVTDNFELCFLAEVPALGFQKYFLTDLNEPSPMHKIEILYHGDVDLDSMSISATKLLASRETMNISNGIIEASFSSQNGSLQELKSTRLNTSLKIKMSFMQYGVRSFNESIPGSIGLSEWSNTTSGAYLFLPDGPARPLSNIDTSYVIIRGPVRNSVVVQHSGPVQILQAVDLDLGSDSLQIRNLVDISNQSDFELIMRMEAQDEKKQPLTDFYTELNGLQMIHRKRYKRLPLQAHFYPMPGAAILQNKQERLSVLGRQPLGVASLKPGQVEIVLDRRLTQDDKRGMGEGVLDNRLTESRFRLMLEPIKVDSAFNSPKKSTFSTCPRSADTSYLSLSAHQNSLILNHPLMTLTSHAKLAKSNEGPFKPGRSCKIEKIPSSLSLINGSLQCDVHIVAFRTLSKPTDYPPRGDPSNSSQYPAPTQYKTSAALVLNRFGVECHILPIKKEKSCVTVSDDTQLQIDSIFRIPPAKVRNATLTLLKVNEEKENGTTNIEPMEIRTWKIDF